MTVDSDGPHPLSDPESSTCSLNIPNRLDQLDRLQKELAAFLTAHGLQHKVLYQIQLVCDELFTNIVSYGFEADGREHLIGLSLTLGERSLTLEIRDDGKPFNPLLKPDAVIDSALEDREIGGLGIHFVRTIMDEMSYIRADRHNVLTLQNINLDGGDRPE